MFVYRRIVRFTLLLVAMVFSASSLAQTNPQQDAGPRWACWYEATNLTIRCMLSRAPTGDQAAQARVVTENIDRRLPGLVRTIWAKPEQLTGQMIHIPLWNVPYDMDFVRELADSVMCGLRTNCSFDFDANADGRAPVRALAATYGIDEAAVIAEAAAQGFKVASVEEEQPQTVRVSPRRRRALAG